ncbi:MAG: hypothetical protein WKG07_03825 [Hymenobacter sp.]
MHPVFIPDDLLIIDEMWHNFILFTPAYHAFCQAHFQKYLHHVPATKQEKIQPAHGPTGGEQASLPGPPGGAAGRHV